MAQGRHPNDPYPNDPYPQEPRAPQSSYGGFSIDPGERPHYSGEGTESRNTGRIAGGRGPMSGGGNSGGGGGRFPGGDARGFGLRGLLVLVVMVACAGALWLAYSRGKHAGGGGSGPVPLIRADSDPIKRKPDDSNSTVDSDADLYNPKQQQQPGVEHLLPPPEQPLPKPVALPAPEASQPPADGSPAAATPAPAGAASADTANSDSQDQIGALMRGEIGGGKPAVANADAVGAQDQLAAKSKPSPAYASSADPGTLQPPARARDSLKADADGNGPFRVQIAATKDDASARSEFARLQRAHPDLLSGLSATVVKADLGARGVYYRVQAGPVPDRAKADKLCGELRAQSIGCIVVH